MAGASGERPVAMTLAWQTRSALGRSFVNRLRLRCRIRPEARGSIRVPRWLAESEDRHVLKDQVLATLRDDFETLDHDDVVVSVGDDVSLRSEKGATATVRSTRGVFLVACEVGRRGRRIKYVAYRLPQPDANRASSRGRSAR